MNLTAQQIADDAAHAAEWMAWHKNKTEQLAAENARLKASNAELMEALKAFPKAADFDPDAKLNPSIVKALTKARAAIERATG